jgi:hypothetical protein
MFDCRVLTSWSNYSSHSYEVMDPNPTFSFLSGPDSKKRGPPAPCLYNPVLFFIGYLNSALGSSSALSRIEG